MAAWLKACSAWREAVTVACAQQRKKAALNKLSAPTSLALPLAFLLHHAAHLHRHCSQARLQLAPQRRLRLAGRPVRGMQLLRPLSLQLVPILQRGRPVERSPLLG